MFGLHMGRMGGRGSAPFSPARWFSAGARGAQYEPSLTNGLCFQNGAGTTPVTALEQLVGLMLATSSGGKSAVQATAGLMPRISARVNRLTKTEQFNDAAWAKQPGLVLTQISGAEWELDFTASADGTGIYLYGEAVPANSPYIASVDMRAVALNGSNAVTMEDPDGSAGAFTSVKTLSTAWSAFTAGAVNGANPTTRGLWLKKAAGGALVVRIRFPQLETGTVATHYQRVNTAGDFDTAGFPVKVVFDSVDDAHVTTFDAALGSNCTVVRSVPGVGTTILTGQTIGTTYTNTVTHSGLIVIDRPLTAAETSAVTRWGNQRAGV